MHACAAVLVRLNVPLDMVRMTVEAFKVGDVSAFCKLLLCLHVFVFEMSWTWSGACLGPSARCGFRCFLSTDLHLKLTTMLLGGTQTLRRAANELQSVAESVLLAIPMNLHERKASGTLEWELWEMLVGRGRIKTYETLCLRLLLRSAEYC